MTVAVAARGSRNSSAIAPQATDPDGGWAERNLNCVTWAIAMPGFPTGGVLLADVRVSFVDPTTNELVGELDGVQKVHRVADNLAVAFAGSVESGFLLAGDLQQSLTNIKPGWIWSPAQVATAWSRRLRWRWRELPAEVKAGSSEFLLLGAFPSSNSSFCYSDAYRFRAPEFELDRLPRGHASSIGSGSNVVSYIAMLESFAEDWGQLAQFSLQPFPAGPGAPMSVVLGELIRETPTPGVSSQLIVCSVGATKTSIFTLESPLPGHSTPPVASTLEEFRQFCRERAVESRIAIASPEFSPRFSDAKLDRQKLGKSSRVEDLPADPERTRLRALWKLPGLDSNQQPSG